MVVNSDDNPASGPNEANPKAEIETEVKTETKTETTPEGEPALLALKPIGVGSSAADTGDAGNVLGANMAALRERVLGQSGRKDLTAAESHDVQDTLRKHHQVDLNEEDNAAALEDPTLIAHMEAARRRLAEQEKAMLRLRGRETLRTEYLAAMNKTSSLVRRAGEIHEAGRESVEIAHLLARSLGELAGGRKVHGYPRLCAAALADADTKTCVTRAGEVSENVAKSHEDLLEAFDTLKQDLFVLRREVEHVGDGFLELLEASEEDRRHLREFLMVANRSKAAQRVADPPETLGERLLAAPDLPEESGIIDGAQGE